jgi:hypothetical protein
LFEKRLIEKYLKVGNKCPISGVELTETDLLSVQGETERERERERQQMYHRRKRENRGRRERWGGGKGEMTSEGELRR